MFPAASLAAMLTWKLTTVPLAKSAAGLNVIVAPPFDQVNVPVTPVGAVIWNAVWADARSIGSLKLTTMLVSTATPTALLAGVTDVIVGGVVSGAAAVVKENVTAAPNWLPAVSRAPVPIVTVYVAAAASALDGWQLVNVPSAFQSQPPWQVTAGLIVIAAEVMVAFIRSEKVIAIADCVATPVAAL